MLTFSYKNIYFFIEKTKKTDYGVYSISFGIENALTLERYIKMHSRKSIHVRTDGKHLERGVINVDDQWYLKKY